MASGCHKPAFFMIQIKKDKYIINIERVDGTIYIRSSGIVPKDVERIIQWLDEEMTRKTLLKEIERK